ncbi:Grx4 family monothiol glutaredoxin [bacterium]|jgi:Grx4 family monothiol glutaredoxin|nr:Grx4 family monothiol glutaredoxin [bacterium]
MNSTQAKIDSILAESPIVVFIKGSRQEPVCGFSKQIIQILESYTNDFSCVNILEHLDIRQEIKTYKNWPTFPQLYVNGELIGGVDIVKELDIESKLEEILSQ